MSRRQSWRLESWILEAVSRINVSVSSFAIERGWDLRDVHLCDIILVSTVVDEGFVLYCRRMRWGSTKEGSVFANMVLADNVSVILIDVGI